MRSFYTPGFTVRTSWSKIENGIENINISREPFGELFKFINFKYKWVHKILLGHHEQKNPLWGHSHRGFIL